MGILNIFYRVFNAYKNEIKSTRGTGSVQNAFLHASRGADRLETIRSECEIDREWLDEIESAMPYVEKAVRAERQFISQNGEVMNIERVKSVSQASVTHLAKHAELITHLPETPGATLVPDGLFVEEKLSDYAVYENRFLYLLLTTLRDFMDMRVQKIRELGMTYRAELQLQKEMRMDKRHIAYTVSYSEENKADPFGSDACPDLSRIEDMQHVVMALLNTPLMTEVAKAPVIHPPITRTNVLKMNTDFKRALELYEYITAYEGDGFTIREKKSTFAPLPEEMMRDFSEVPALEAYLTYQYGNGLSGKLKEEYEAEEREKRAKEAERIDTLIAAVRRRLEEGKITPEEYIDQLEKAVSGLTEVGKECRLQMAHLESAAHDAEDERRALASRLKEREQEIDRLVAEKKSEETAHTAAIRELQQACDDTLRAERAEREEEKCDLLRRTSEAEDAAREADERLSETEARLNAALLINGEADEVAKNIGDAVGRRPENGYSADRRTFVEVEKQYRLFTEYYRKTWKSAKKSIWHRAVASAQARADVKKTARKITVDQSEDGKGGKGEV